jgi:chromosome partitioning protein
MFESRVSLPNEVRADIEQFLDSARGTSCAWAQAQVLPCFIRRNIKLAEAPSYGKTIFEYEPSCHGSEDYKKVAEFIHTQLQPASQPKIQPAALGENQEPPIEIKSVSQSDLQTPPSEFTQTTATHPLPESQ